MARNVTLALSFCAALLVSSGAYAADIIASDTAPSLQPARMVCESSGRCWRVAPRDAVIGDTYNRYNGGRVCMDWEGYPCASRGAELPPSDADNAPAYGYRY